MKEMKMAVRQNYSSTPAAMERLAKSMTWKDICDELDIWIEQMQMGVEDPDLKIDLRVQDMMRGILQACRNFKQMPSVLLYNMELDLQHDRRDREKQKKED